MPDSIYIGNQARSFTTAPRFAEYDMVVLNIDENTYVSSPHASVTASRWSDRANGEHVFVYNGSQWSYNGTLYTTVQLQSTFGLAVSYPACTAAKEGDTITVHKTTNDGEVKVSADFSRSGRCLEGNCPMVHPDSRQAAADDVLAKVIGYRYQPYAAGRVSINPAVELGDAMTAFGVYGGIYEQKQTFGRLMVSDIGAPGQADLDYEIPYKTRQERQYSRRFAELVSEFSIMADSISAKVSRSGGDSASFGWELELDHWSVLANGTPRLYIDNSLARFTGKVQANEIEVGTITVGGRQIDAGYIQGTQIGQYTVSGGVGGNLGYAGNSGIIGANLENATIETAQTSSGINTSLGYANFANGVFAASNTARYVKCQYLVDTSGYHYGPVNLTINGTSYRLFAWSGGSSN